VYASTGATEQDVAELDQLAERLRNVGATVLNVADAIETIELPLPPSLEVVNEEQAYELVRNFMMRRSTGIVFTLGDIRDELQNAGLDIQSNKLNRWFKNWMDDIKQEYIEQGERVTWWSEKVSRHERQYALAVIISPEQMAVDAQAAVVEPTVAKPEVRYIYRPKVYTPLEITDTHRQQFKDLLAESGPNDRAKLLVERLAKRIHGDVRDARGVFDEAIANGSLFSHRREGSLYFTTQPVDQGESARVESPKKRPRFTELDALVADRLMNVLDSHSSAQSKGLLMREIANLLDGPDLDEARLPWLVRQLENVGMAERYVSRQGAGSAQPRFRVPYAVRRTISDPTVRAEAIEAIRARYTQ
jgi:hypothetical protein